MKVLIIGGGKVGYYLALTLIEKGHHPTIIEEKKTACARLANQLDIPVICGDGTTLEVLSDAGIEEMQAVVSVTGKDEANLIACQLAKNVFRVAKTITRVNNPKNAKIMKKLGVDHVINGTENLALLIERQVDTSAIKQVLSLNAGDIGIFEVVLPRNYVLDGVALSQLDFPHDAVIVSIIREEQTLVPRGNSILSSRDRVLILAKNTMVKELKKKLRVEDTE